MSDKKTVEHISMLARLRYEESQKDEVAKNLAKVLAHVEQLGEIKAENVEPLYSPLLENMKEVEAINRGREDSILPSLGADDLLQNAPEKKQNQFVVHAVIDEN